MAIIMSIFIVESESNQETEIKNNIDEYPGFNIYEKILILKYENYYENYNSPYNKISNFNPNGIMIPRK
jgi:hypothetical protein